MFRWSVDVDEQVVLVYDPPEGRRRAACVANDGRALSVEPPSLSGAIFARLRAEVGAAAELARVVLARVFPGRLFRG